MSRKATITAESAAEEVKALARLFEESAPKSEPDPATLPDPSGYGFSESELPALRTIYQTTIDKGHALHKCNDADQAQRWADWLNTYLPEDRECFVIRNREVNCYTVTDEVHPNHNAVANIGDNPM